MPYMMDKKIVLVTGAAKGIGSTISKQMIKAGYYTLLVDVDDKNGKELEKDFGDENAKFYCADISNEHEVKTLYKFVMDNYGRIDVLVNNAGIIRDNIIWKMPTEDFDEVIRVNLRGTWLMCQEAASIMRSQKNGRIINIASRAWLGNAGQSNYSASKAGIVGLTKVLALELGRYNIFVNAVAPGLIDTPLTQDLPENVRQKLIDRMPTKCIGQPEDVANVVSFLSSDKTRFITGQILYVDGGTSIGSA
ncbi:MAG: beta-ketoacyl-ACP reductase [Bacteroidetes bacterium]|nr:MAG: beta-ketoacyl-ACP reductase [Bacteroidota bacterium]